MRKLHAVTLRWMLALSIAIVVGLELFAGLGLSLLFGPGYEDRRSCAPSPSRSSSSSPTTPSPFLVALHGQKWNAVFALLCLALNCGLNLVLIPRLEEVGAALATVATEGLLFRPLLLDGEAESSAGGSRGSRTAS
ncbi:MAG: polysaccharide biosynthesis C-terminal domain-containing protein [Candidatus Eisenbacteria bacterium]